jgi:hypothetical protein
MTVPYISERVLSWRNSRSLDFDGFALLEPAKYESENVVHPSSA